jgi:hypothetical protein
MAHESFPKIDESPKPRDNSSLLGSFDWLVRKLMEIQGRGEGGNTMTPRPPFDTRLP